MNIFAKSVIFWASTCSKNSMSVATVKYLNLFVLPDGETLARNAELSGAFDMQNILMVLHVTEYMN